MRPITMPQLALGAETVIAQEWLVAAGEAFEEGAPLLEIETDKAQMEVEAVFAGTLLGRLCEPGDTVEVGAVIGYAVEDGGDVEAGLAEFAARDGAPAGVAPEAAAAPAAAPVATAPPATAPAAPLRFVAVEEGDLAGLVAYRTAAAPSPARRPPAEALDDPAAAGPHRRAPLSRRRLAIARRMSAATAIPAFSVQRDVAAGAGLRAVAEARAAGHRVTFTDVLLQAVGAAAAAEPSANAWLVDGEVLAFEQVGVALAVDTPDGVVGPVVRGVESAGLPEIAAARADLVARARSGALQARELTGATITLSNVAGLGAHGITPVLTAPQVCALGVGSARPAGAGSLVSVTFVGDHRALDGADGARFLAAFAAALDAVSPTRED